MEGSSFIPYWQPLGDPAGPNSWVFFVVAQVAGHHRPLAVVSSVGDNDPLESLQGYPLAACCRRIVTIFSDPANHVAIRAELTLAASYYKEHSSDATNDEYLPKLVELPQLNRRQYNPDRYRPWDRMHIPEFPFIATCLVQGVGFSPQTRRTAAILLEPLGTVYRDDSVEWGMVIIDITQLEAVRYGIVGFTVDMAKFVATPRDAWPPFTGATGTGVFEEGPLRVIEDPRPRRVMSAAEYMSKFKYTTPPRELDVSACEILAGVPLVDTAVMDTVWPGPSPRINDIRPSSISLVSPLKTEMVEQSEAISRLIQRAIELGKIDESILTGIRSIPNYQGLLRDHLIRQHFDALSTRTDAQSIGELVRLGFTNSGHLGLEQLTQFPAVLISIAWNTPANVDTGNNESLSSVSFCVDSVQGSLAELADILSRLDNLRELYLLQKPTQECDNLSIRLLEELAARPHVLQHTKVMLASAYSCALRKMPWLPDTICYNTDNTLQHALLSAFPVQQILVRQGRDFPPSSPHKYIYFSISLHDGLLKPQRFAAGFLLYLVTLVPDDILNQKAQVFSFSSSPASLAADPLSAAEVSPILAENFTLPDRFPDDTTCSPLVHDLNPVGWTVIVTQDACPRSRSLVKGWQQPNYIRYAFVRPRREPIAIDESRSLESLGPENLEVVGLKEFLAITSPEIDPALVDRRIAEVQQRLAEWEENLPSDIEPLSVLMQTEAAEILHESLRQARERNKRLRNFLAEDHEGVDFYF
ncbi:hypothetical protein F5Y08DRAFT_348406 [Xylaria arbuscula]|nr:hypothetical protein F5Y08DRAFT_348406 [Xylaria arbuscula]